MSLLPIFGASPYVCNAQKVIGPPLSTHEKGTLLVGGLGAATGAIIGAAAGRRGPVPPSAVYLVRAVVTWRQCGSRTSSGKSSGSGVRSRIWAGTRVRVAPAARENRRLPAVAPEARNLAHPLAVNPQTHALEGTIRPVDAEHSLGAEQVLVPEPAHEQAFNVVEAVGGLLQKRVLDSGRRYHSHLHLEADRRQPVPVYGASDLIGHGELQTLQNHRPEPETPASARPR
jgi:hypothetical protein